MQMEFFDTFDRQLAQVCSPAVLRKIMGGESGMGLWQSIEASGFLDLLVPESMGGAGLGWQDAWGVMFAAGRHGVPLPVGATLVARAYLAACGSTAAQQGPVAVAGFSVAAADGGLTATQVHGGRFAPLVLTQHGDAVFLLPVAAASMLPVGDSRSFDAQLQWDQATLDQHRVGALAPGELAQGLALALAVQLAGAADRTFEMTLGYANDRVQFGKPIGRFQAVQQQITEMAERVYGLRMATQLGCQSADWRTQVLPAAMAKSQASSAAGRIASLAHAVHGAIGVTHEYDLHLYTRCLYEWSLVGGGAGYWSARLGQAALKVPQPVSDFVRQALFQAD